MRRAALLLAAAALLQPGCRRSSNEDLKATITRYNQLLTEGYRKLDMTPLQAVASPELATKAYHHMSAIGEGKLRMESTVQEIEFRKVDKTSADRARVETKETWDFKHVEISTGKTFSEEKGFVYEMTYELAREAGGWRVRDASTLSGTSTETVVPWPKIDREKGVVREGGSPR